MSKELGPFIPLYYGDFIGGTMSFGADEVGAYLLLICYQWQNGHIENDPQAIERIARCEYGHLQRVLKKFKSDGNGGLINERCEQIRQERKAFMENARESGIRGYEARWGKLPPSADSNPDRVPNRVPNSKPDTSSSSSSSSSSPSSSISKEREEWQRTPETGRPLPPTKRVIFNFDSMNIEGITDEDRANWQEAYPALDIYSETAKARQWLVANPDKRKKNVYRFLTNWFSRAQERGGSKPSNQPTKGRTYDHSIS